MSQTSPLHRRSCPYLGLQADRASIFLEPALEHRCFVSPKGQRVDLEQQIAFCLTPGFEGCPHFATPAAAGAVHPKQKAVKSYPPVRPRLSLWAWLEGVSKLQVAAWLVTLILVGVAVYYYLNMRRSLVDVVPPATTELVVVMPTLSPSPVITASATVVRHSDSPILSSTPLPPLPTLSLPPGQMQVALYPAGNAVGWVSSADPLNHFGDRNLHVGRYEGQTYYGAIQFNLASIPAGSKIEAATLELMGLSTEHLGRGGAWSLRLLSQEADKNWGNATSGQVQEAEVFDTILPELQPHDLGVRQPNTFTFAPAHLAELARRLESGLISFRLDGPSRGPDNLFTWDTGYGGGFGHRPTLRVIYQLPPTPTPMVVVELPATPTPANAVTAAALAATATYEATASGTPTPTSANIVTATPPVVVTPTPRPENAATAAWLAAVATAETFLYGTPTPLPTDFWTATPTPTPVIVTSTPTAENLLTAVPLAVAATQMAATIGTATPLPPNWVTPIVYTPNPPPGNEATAAYEQVMATAAAIVFGTPTPTPLNMWTATPTPIFVLLYGEVPTPRPTPTATATPRPIPLELIGKIAFLSNRGVEEGEEPLVYVVDPDGSNLALLTERWPYDLACARDVYSADQRFRVFTKNITHNRVIGEGETEQVIPEEMPAVFWYDAYYNAEEQVTHFGAGYAYQGVWSPTREQVALVSNDSGDDEIWVVNRDGSNLLQLTASNEAFNGREIGKDNFVPEVNRHPSWSPDGSKIVYWTNPNGPRQIWVMDADGNNKYSFSRTGFDDWDPVWIKYTDPPPIISTP